jgi:N-acyl-D-amino-acid deacylase
VAAARAPAKGGAGKPTAPAEPSEAAPDVPFAATERFALWIRGGSVIDGTGRARRRADVLVKNDGTIAHVGAVDPSVTAAKIIDASGKVVTPGFIDAHSHGDPLGDASNFVAMGVTTLCIGQDGKSPSDERISTWSSRVSARKPTLNVVPFVGHATIRTLAGVGANAEPSARQLARMKELVAEAMKDGAFGLTTGLEYIPGRGAKLPELIEAAKPVGEAGGLIMSHLRSEDDDTIDGALDELLAMGERSGAHVHVSHLKIVYGRGAERAEMLLLRLNAARAKGLKVTADIYPYTASLTGIDILFPDWARAPNAYSEVLARRREELRAHLRRRVGLRNGPEATLFVTAPFAGKTLAQVAREQRKSFEEVLVDLGPTGASAAYFVMDESLQTRLLLDPNVMIGTDGSAGTAHPRGYGTFARVIREVVVERKLLTLEEAVRKMTGLPASAVGLDRSQRGLLAKGYAADVNVFAPDQVRDTATFQRPNRLAEGFDTVIVSGVPVREGGKATGARPGRVIRRE